MTSAPPTIQSGATPLTLIRHATIYDGLGNDPLVGDCAVKGDTIFAVDPDLSALLSQAQTVIDASGLALMPGLIDAHTHSDAFTLIEPDAPSKLMQGVTTEIGGQCGGSAAPRLNGAKLPSDWEAQTYPPNPNHPELATAHGPNWTSVADFRACFDAAKPALNMILFSGHNTLRKGVTGDAPRPVTPTELAQMCFNLEQALEEGSWGLSTGLVYHPGIHATSDEVITLAQVAAKRGAHYATHMRSEGDALLEAIDEVLDLARKTGIRTQISHLKTAGKANWDKITPALDKFNAFRTAGYHLYSDRYPYLSAGTDLDILLPPWASDGGYPTILPILDDPQQATILAKDLDQLKRDPATIMIGGTWVPENTPYQGKTLEQIMDETHQTIGQTIVSILKADRSRTGAFFFGMSEANLDRIYQEPWIMPGSDASLRAPTGPLALDHPHPRAYGTMPRFYRHLTQRLQITPQEAIRRMTSLPAQAFCIPKRGAIQVGYAADLLLVDLDNWQDHATYSQPHQFTTGVHTAIINGVLAVSDYSPTSHPRAGRFLTRQ